MSGGLLHSAQSLLAGLLALARTRLDLFGTELQEGFTRLLYTVVGAVAVLLLAALAAGFAGLALLIAVPDEYRAVTAACLAASFLALAALVAWSMRRLAVEKPRLLSDTVAELQRDYDAVRP